MLGLRLDKALSLLEDVQSRSRAEFLIDQGFVTLNKKPAKPSHKVTSHDEIFIQFPEASSSELRPLPLALDILFEDNDLIVLNKPSGLVVHPAAGHEQDTLVNALIHHTKDLSMKFGENRPGIVHRLDRDTSGILVVAKNDFTHEGLALQFRNKTNHRVYFAVGLGLMKNSSGTIQSFLARHPSDRKKYASVRNNLQQIIRDPKLVPEHGKWAVTHYKVIKNNPAGFSYLQLKLETGRTHQIRVHLAELGCPILADEIYTSSQRLHAIKNLGLRLQLQEFPRLALHAAELGFVHPRTQKDLFFQQDWPTEIITRLTELALL